MASRLPGALLSTAVVSSLLLTAAPAHATDAAQSSITITAEDNAAEELVPSDSPADAPEPAPPAPPVAPDAAEEQTEPSQPTETAAPLVDQVPPTSVEPAEPKTDEPQAAEPLPLDSKSSTVEPTLAESDMTAESSQPAEDAPETDIVGPVPVPGPLQKSGEAQAKDHTVSFGYVESEVPTDEEAFWDFIDRMYPEGTENWGEAEWDAFYETEEGQNIDRLITEFYENLVDDEEFELTDEEQAFLDELERLIPEGSEDWDEAQWEEFFGTDKGRELLSFVIGSALDQAENDAELQELIDSYREFFADDSGWFEEFLARYLGYEISDDGDPDPNDTESAGVRTSEANTEPVVKIVPAASVQEEVAEKVAPEAQATPQTADVELASTGSNALLAAAGLLIILLGSITLRAARKSVAK